jgi:hypothetical protein
MMLSWHLYDEINKLDLGPFVDYKVYDDPI